MYVGQCLRISSEFEKFRISVFEVRVSAYIVFIPSSPSKYWMRGWAVSPRRRWRFGTASVRFLALCSNFAAMISGSVAVKYLRRFLVVLEMSPLILRRLRMSYVVTRLMLDFVAICETREVPSSINER